MEIGKALALPISWKIEQSRTSHCSGAHEDKLFSELESCTLVRTHNRPSISDILSDMSSPYPVITDIHTVASHKKNKQN